MQATTPPPPPPLSSSASTADATNIEGGSSARRHHAATGVDTRNGTTTMRECAEPSTHSRTPHNTASTPPPLPRRTIRKSDALERQSKHKDATSGSNADAATAATALAHDNNSSAEDSDGERSGGPATVSSSLTSSQYLYAIQQDLKAIVHLQQQQLQGRVEAAAAAAATHTPPLSALSQQQQQQQQLSILPQRMPPFVRVPSPSTTPVTALTSSGNRLHSIDAVKQAMLQQQQQQQHDTAVQVLSPPPPMPPLERVSSSMVSGGEVNATIHTSSTTTIMSNTNHNYTSKTSSQQLQQRTASPSSRQSAQIAALPPPPPSSSPIPASLVEYHAYLMQLEHQQRQHDEVLRRQRRQERKRAVEHHEDATQAQGRRSRSAGAVEGWTGELRVGDGATPPRQRLGASASPPSNGGKDTAAGAGKDRRNRSPPLALMMQTLRERGGDEKMKRAAGAPQHHLRGWDGTYTDTDAAESEESCRPTRQVRESATSAASQSRRQQQQQRSTPHRVRVGVSATPPHAERTSSRRLRKTTPQRPSATRQPPPEKLSLGHPTAANIASSTIAEQQAAARRNSNRARRPASRSPSAPQRSPLRTTPPPPPPVSRHSTPGHRSTSKPRRLSPAHERHGSRALRQQADAVDTGDITAQLDDVSPIQRAPPSLLGHRDLNDLSVLHRSSTNDVHPAAAAPSITLAATSSSSPVEAFADALLLDASGGGGGGGNNAHAMSAVAAATANTLAAVLPAALAAPRHHSSYVLPAAGHSAATIGTATTTTMVGGTAAVHEPITFSIAPGGLVVPLSVESPYQHPRQQLLQGREVVRRQQGVVEASSATPSTSHSPDRVVANAADTTAAMPDRTLHSSGGGAAAAAATTLTTAVLHPREHFPYSHMFATATTEEVVVTRSPEEVPLGEEAPYTGHPPAQQQQQQQHHHRAHQHGHHRHYYSNEGISSMIPEHGTGTPRSSRYRNNSTGTGAANRGSRRQQRQVRKGAGGSRSRSARLADHARDAVDDNNNYNNNVTSRQERRVNAKDTRPAAAREEREEEEGEEGVVFGQQRPHASSRVRRVPRHCNGDAHPYLFTISTAAPVGEEAPRAARKELERAEGNARSTSRGETALGSTKARGSSGDHKTTGHVAAETPSSAANPHASGRPRHHRPPPPPPPIAAVWHAVKQMWAPRNAPPRPFAAAYRYYPHGMTEAAPLLHPPPSLHVDAQPREHGAAADSSPSSPAPAAAATAAASASFLAPHAANAPAPSLCVTDSLIGAALQDVLPACRARQRKVAREVDRRRYQLTAASTAFSSFTV